MKVLKKIGVGIISLGLISTFYIPEAKANLTVFEFANNGTSYAIKKVDDNDFPPPYGIYILKKIGSGNKKCKTLIGTPSQLTSFINCVEAKIGTDMVSSTIYDLISSYSGF